MMSKSTKHILLVLTAGLLFLGGIGTAQAVEPAPYDSLPSLDAQINKPTSVAVDGSGRVYVAESLNNRVRVFTQGGVLLGSLNGLVKPSCVAVDGSGRLYVGSAWKGSVTVYDSGLHELFMLGAGSGEFIEPADVDIDATGQIYVVDTQKNQILVYSGTGQFEKAIGSQGNGNGQFNHPASLAIDPVSSELVVLDRKQIFDGGSQSWIDGARIQYLKMDGTFVRGYDKFGYALNSGQMVMPAQVAVDGSSRVYVTDARQQKVLVYSNTDSFLGLIDNQAEPLRTPMGLSLSPTNRLYVASLLSGRVNVFGIGSYSAMGIAPATLSFTATEGGNAPVPQATTITNSGKNELAWTAQTGTAWLSLSAAAGTISPSGTGPVTVEANNAGLAVGEYTGSVQITAPGMVEQVAVSLTVKPNPLQVSPQGLSISTTTGTTPAAQVLHLGSGGGAPLSWTASVDQGWLSLNKLGGTTPGDVKVYANTAGLKPGSYGATITVGNQTSGGSVKVAVSLNIGASDAPPTEPPTLPDPGKGGKKSGGKLWSVIQPVPGVALRGVWGSGARNLLTVGDGGTVLQYDGKNWSALSSGAGTALRSVWGAGENDAYTVGDGGVALHYDGKSWSAVNSGTEENLLDVWGSAADVMAAGMLGTVFDHTFATSGNQGVALRSLWGSSASDVFAVGESGAVLHYDGAAWTPMASGATQWLNGVWGSSATDVFAVGEGGAIVHYDGTVWSAMVSGVSEALHGVYGRAPNDVFAVGDNGVVLHYDGAAWSVLLAGGVNLSDVWMTDRLVVAVGDDGTILTGNPGSFPWNITTRNIAVISVLKKMDQKKAEADKGPKTEAATGTQNK